MDQPFFVVSLQAMPVELICHILGELEMRDLLTCTLVTKHLRRTILESSRLQYTIELAKHRMVSLLPLSLAPSYATRLNLLRDRERAWRYMDWKKSHRLRLPPTGSVYEFVGGLYGNGKEDASRMTDSISFLELPSADSFYLDESPRDLQSWTHVMEDIKIIDFTMDPSRDLLVLVALAHSESPFVYELHFRSIRTNRAHPRAPISVFPCLSKPPHPSNPLIAAVRVQACGNLIAFLIKEVFDGNTAHLEIWNWENGPQYSCSLSQDDGIDDFTFLTDDSFLIVCPTGKFEVYTFTNPVANSTTPLLHITYEFPPLSDGYTYWYISMSSNPAPGYVPRPSPDLNAQNPLFGNTQQLYYPHPNERIHACCLYLFKPGDDDSQVHSFVFFLNLHTLLYPDVSWLPSPNPRTSKAPKKRLSFSASPPNQSSDRSDVSISPPPGETPKRSSMTFPISAERTKIGNSSSEDIHLSHKNYQRVNQLNGFESKASHFSHRVKSRASDSSSKSGPHSPSPGRNKVSAASLPSKRKIRIPWEVWGPQSTRWFEECISTDWQHAIYGLRAVESIKPDKQTDIPIAAIIPEPGDEANGYDDYLDSPMDGVSLTSSAQDNGQHANHERSPSPINDDIDVDHDNASQPQAGQKAERKRYLRLRDFNPYSFAASNDPSPSDFPNGKGKQKACWRIPRLVNEPSTTNVKGAFTKDIVSSLPYMEVISQDTFEVTDVMMDDCRLLLLKRGMGGKLTRVDVLLM